MARTSIAMERGLQTNTASMYECGRCEMCYYDYKQLLEHLYWRHGTESKSCRECGLKRWLYAAHICHVLPIFVTLLDDNPEYCICKQEVDAPMIGCDGPSCKVQWFHFSCVGIVTPPDGDWLCPECSKLELITKKLADTRKSTNIES